mmetsp:Transcript_28220/g.29412  ORF Transcript_28220/g.29412 Transcript_28220/m.29412 type:complete len:125 (+) Transcript_28220:35-409(+)
MEISRAQDQCILNNINNLQDRDFYNENDSNKTQSNSTNDNVSTEPNVDAHLEPLTRPDFVKLINLIDKERNALNSSSSQDSPVIKKPSFMELKNNVQIIQHNLDTIFSFPGKKLNKKLKREEDM